MKKAQDFYKEILSYEKFRLHSKEITGITDELIRGEIDKWRLDNGLKVAFLGSDLVEIRKLKKKLKLFKLP